MNIKSNESTSSLNLFNENQNKMTLIRVTTHDHFHQKSDISKHFKVKNRFLEYEMDGLNQINDMSAQVSHLNDFDDSDDETSKTSSANIRPPKRSWKEIVLININEIVSASEFESLLNAFLLNTIDKTLIVQCTNNDNNEFLHNLHIQYLIEKAKHSAIQTLNENKKIIPHKQIIVILYMSRVDYSSIYMNNYNYQRLTSAFNVNTNHNKINAQSIQSQQFPLIFNLEWHHIYCDALLPSEIKVTDLNINVPFIKQSFENRIARHAESLIISTFELALNHIRFPIQMRGEIDRIKKMVSGVNKLIAHGDFTKRKGGNELTQAIISRVQNVLSSSKSGPIDTIKKMLNKLNNITERKSILLDRGSFRQCIIKGISTRMKSEFIEVLFAMLNYGSSKLYLPQTEKSIGNYRQLWMNDTWLNLLKQSNIIGAKSNIDEPSDDIKLPKINNTNNKPKQPSNPTKLNRIWSLEENTPRDDDTNRVRRASSVIDDESNNLNTYFKVDDDLQVKFPFSPYIDSYFRRIKREIEKMAEDKIGGNKKNGNDFLFNESFISGQLKVIRILESTLKESQLDIILNINKYIEDYTYDMCTMYLRKLFGNRYENNEDKGYFIHLCTFIQKFILCAAYQAHEDIRPVGMLSNVVSPAQSLTFQFSDQHQQINSDNDEDQYFIANEQTDSESDQNFMADLGDDSSEDDDDDEDEYSDDYSTSGNKSDNDSDGHRDDIGIIEEKEPELKSEEKDEKEEEKEAIPEEKYPFGIHEVYASFWCNSNIISELTKILSIYETKHIELSRINLLWEQKENNNNMIMCIANILKQILDFIINEFSRGDGDFFKLLMNMIMDCEKSITYLLNWFEKQDFDALRLGKLNNHWNFIQLYVLCYSPFTKFTDGSDVKGIQKHLEKITEIFKDRIFDTTKKVKSLCNLIRDICQTLQLKNKFGTEEIVQYVIQRYINTFAFGYNRNKIPNLNFVQYMIGLISNNNSMVRDDSNDDDSKFTFTANSFTKQEIAIQILDILVKFDSDDNDKNRKDIMAIKTKLSDALDTCPLLSSVLLRAKEREEHAKWLSRKKKKQKPNRNDIGKAQKELFSTEKLTYLEQILSVACCKVVIYNVVIHWTEIQKDEKIIKTLCTMFKHPNDSTTTFNQLINGLGFYFFSEIWRYQGCQISRSLSKIRAFQKTVLFKNIFENIDTTSFIKDEQHSMFQEQMSNATHKIFDDNIFNLLKDDGHSLRSLTASAFTLRKLQKTVEKTFRRFKTQPDNNNNIDELKSMDDNNMTNKPKVAKDKQKRSSHVNLDKNRFSIISNAIYECLHKKKKIPTDLSLDKHEFVHFIGGIFNFSFLYCGKAETRRLESWMNQHLLLEQNTVGKKLLHDLLTNSSGDSQLRLKPGKSNPPPLEHVQRIRLSWHLFGVAFSIVRANPFRKLIENPIYYQNGYLIGQPEPSDTQLLKASVGQYLFINKITKMKYFVQSHQKQFEIMRGNICIGKIDSNGNIISGNSMSVSKSASESDDILYGIDGPNTPSSLNYQPVIPREYQSLGYILIDNKQTEDATRNLSEIGVYILRCFIECCLWLHQSQSHSDSNMDLVLFIGYPQRILPSDVSHKIQKKIAKYILKLQNCLGRSHEDVLYILHAVIHRLYLKYNDKYPFGDKAHKSIASREEFELFFMADCVEPVIQNLDMSINSVRSVVSEDLFKKYWSKRIDMGFKNNDIDEKEKNDFIRTYNAHLFLPFRNNTTNNFRAYILKKGEISKQKCLFGIIDTLDSVGNSIYLTQNISDIVQWMKLVRKRLNGRISRKEIEEKDSETGEYIYTAQWLLNKCKEENLGDHILWKEKWAAFVNCFNHVARRISSNQNNNNLNPSLHRNESAISYSDQFTINNENGIVNNTMKEEIKEANQNIGGMLLGHDLPTAGKDIQIILPKKNGKSRGIQPSDVPLKLCINYSSDNNQSNDTPPIHAILRHLVSVNELLLYNCRGKNHKYDTIQLRNVSRRQDCVDIDETEFVKILQNCTQQSLEYGKSSTFTMNLPLLEAKLYERYIIGKKLINYNKNQLLFTFAGQHNIKSYVDEINDLYDRNKDKLYFEDCSKSLLKTVYEKLQQNQSKISLKSLSQRDLSEDNKKTIKLIASTKQGIEQTLIALLRWPALPNRDSSIYDFMKNNLKLFEDEYHLFNEMKNLLFLKHCESLWKYLDKLYIMKQGKWYQIPRNLLLNYKSEIKKQEIKIKLKQFTNQFDLQFFWQFLREWQEFIENRLCDKNKIITKHADQYTLKHFLEKDGLNMIILKKFPQEIKLSQTGDAYHIVAQQYKTLIDR